MAAAILCLRYGITRQPRFNEKSYGYIRSLRSTAIRIMSRNGARFNGTANANLNGRELTFDTETLAQLADGSATVKFGHSSVLATVVSSRKPAESDFVNLKVDYREKAAAMGFIPSNYKRKDLGPTEKEILTGRLIDRSVRSLFPKGYENETQIICTLLAADGMNNPDILGINAASASLCVSDIPWNGPVGAVRIGDIDGELVINPTRQELQQSSLNLVIASSEHRVVMLEGSGKEVTSIRMIEAISKGHLECQSIIHALKELQNRVGKAKRSFTTTQKDPEELMQRIQELSEVSIRNIFLDSTLTKLPRDQEIRKIQENVIEKIKEDFPDEDYQTIAQIFNKIVKQTFRNNILTGLGRCDGRTSDQLRPISCDVDLFKPLHGSAVFKRGETQVFCTVTFDSAGPVIRSNRREKTAGNDIAKHFFLHYEFPPFSNNEIGLTAANSRREIGHGSLAEKALAAIVPQGFPFTIRLTSQVMMSNGSSSMASVCGGSLALMDAGVPICEAVAGVACGLVTSSDSTDDDVKEYKLLTDILGIEDYLGDMDFKMAGTRNGITALQADFKIPGLPLRIVKEAIHKATDDRMKVLDIMNSVISEARSTPKENGPVTESVHVPLRKRSQFLGPGGMNIKQLENVTGVSVDMLEEEKWTIFAPSPSAMKEARSIIDELLEDKPSVESLLEYGAIYEGRIVELKPYGVMVELLPGMPPALLHNAQLDHRKIYNHEALGLEVNQPIRVKYFGRDPASGRMRISRKAILPAPKRQEYERELESVYNQTVLDSVRKTMDS
ncbi:polyribonucleotide nucleotidyltransferase 1, mitochondrial-like [Dendronephthya gigantea]|uniref:polyribonucleotide nucleotidyltransferase 1, mitochondrial-like n=1 Tax=Dendronephthya gigantea TaxID=151771 RepID=UPI00106AE4B0|nr:polyribonucleotide nucleotidyltransferase 1, mitochondrial-like [Dendronephthya gigantea]